MTFDEVYDRVHFELHTDGRYRLRCDHHDRKIAPMKVIDIRGRYSSYRKSLFWGASSQGVKQFANFVHFAPGLSGLIYASMERFFNLVEISYLTRRAMALNMVMEALDGNRSSPFYGVLNDTELTDSVTFLRRSSMMLADIIYNGFVKKNKLAKKYIRSSAKTRRESLQYLNDKDYTVYPFDNSFYALGIKRSSKGKIKEMKVFSLIKNKFWGHEPHDVVDFIHPKHERAKRNIGEAVMVGLSFVPVPFAVSIIRILYKEAVIREFHRRDMAEAGYRTHLNHNRDDLISALRKEGFTREASEDLVNIAYRNIYKREMNPVDIEHDQEAKYVHYVNNWISARSPNYQPVPLEPIPQVFHRPTQG